MIVRLRDWWLADAPQTWVLPARAILTACLLGHALAAVPSISLLYGNDGYGFGVRKVLTSLPFLSMLGGAAPFLVWGQIIGAIAVLFGRRKNLWFAVILAIHVILLHLNEWVYWGWGAMMVPFGGYVLLAGTTSRGNNIGPQWPRRLMQIHLTAMYAVIGLPRFSADGWLGGWMLYNAATHQLFSRIDWHAGALLPVLKLGSYFAMVLEPVAIFSLWWRRTRVLTVVALTALHLGIEMVATVGYWNWLLIGCLLVFLPESNMQWLRALGQRARARVAGSTGRSTDVPT